MNIITRSKKNKYLKNTDEGDEELEDTYIHVENNNIYFYSEIHSESILKLRIEMKKLIDKYLIFSVIHDCDPLPVKLHLNSIGGEVKDAMIIVDLILTSKVPIYTIIEGEAASAATLISVVGHKRYIHKNANMLIHQITSGFWGKMMEIEDEMKNLNLYMNKLKEIYRDNTKIAEKRLEKMLKKDILWSSSTCLKYGLVDEIIE